MYLGSLLPPILTPKRHVSQQIFVWVSTIVISLIRKHLAGTLAFGHLVSDAALDHFLRNRCTRSAARLSWAAREFACTGGFAVAGVGRVVVSPEPVEGARFVC